MGDLVVPIEYGDDCSPRFAAGKTPLYIFCAFAGITRCIKGGCHHDVNELNGHVFKLRQMGGLPCHWLGSGGDWSTEVSLPPAPGTGWVKTTDPHGNLYFLGFGDAIGGTTFTNASLCNQAGRCTTGGFAAVAWNPNLLDLLYEYNLCNEEGTRFEFLPNDDEKIIIKFANVLHRMNILVKYDPYE